MGKKVEFEGKIYSSLKELCSVYKVNYNSAISLMSRRGYTLEEAIYGRVNNYIYKGVEYKNLKELCVKLNLSYPKVLYRINTGKNIEEAIENINVRKNNSKEIEYEGKKFKSIKDLCEYKEVPYRLYIQRKKRGKNLEECLFKGKYNNRGNR